MQHINLIDATLLPQQRLLGSAALLASLMACALAVAVHLGVEMRLTQRTALAQAATANTAAADGTTPAAATGPNAELQAQIASREALKSALQSHAQLPKAPAQLLADVAAALPNTMWLSEIDISGAHNLRIAGGLLEPTALPRFAEQLAQVQALRGLPIHLLRLEPAAAERSAGDELAIPASHRFMLASGSVLESSK
jgi:hypothetical protein